MYILLYKFLLTMTFFITFELYNGTARQPGKGLSIPVYRRGNCDQSGLIIHTSDVLHGHFLILHGNSEAPI